MIKYIYLSIYVCRGEYWLQSYRNHPMKYVLLNCKIILTYKTTRSFMDAPYYCFCLLLDWHFLSIPHFFSTKHYKLLVIFCLLTDECDQWVKFWDKIQRKWDEEHYEEKRSIEDDRETLWEKWSWQHYRWQMRLTGLR